MASAFMILGLGLVVISWLAACIVKEMLLDIHAQALSILSFAVFCLAGSVLAVGGLLAYVLKG